MPKKTRTARQCPFCPLVYYAKGALTLHINNEHWDEKPANG